MKNLLCSIGIHDWEINQVGTARGKRFQVTNYHRTCQRDLCRKEQSLERPKEYHPSAYVWTNIKEDKR